MYVMISALKNDGISKKKCEFSFIKKKKRLCQNDIICTYLLYNVYWDWGHRENSEHVKIIPNIH